ncbi:MAG TPA: SH3 domain-containing protein [Ardenticatenaceae bacterium]|nr:SH3 domain-containing protein [Ardenticatenaceae bacterium]
MDRRQALTHRLASLPWRPHSLWPLGLLVSLAVSFVLISVLWSAASKPAAAIAPAAPTSLPAATTVPTAESPAAVEDAPTTSVPTTSAPTVTPVSEAAPAATETPGVPPTATARPAPRAATVAVSLLNVRTGPGVEYPILMALEFDVEVYALGISADGAWVQVILPDMQVGWVSAPLISYDDGEPLPVVEVAAD